MDGHRNEEGNSGPDGAGTTRAGGPAVEGAPSEGLEVKVLFSTHAGTLAALELVSRLGAHLGVRPVVLLFFALPHALPLSWPVVSQQFLEERVGALAREAPSEITARIYLCRSARQSLDQILPPHSLIVLGGRRGWRGSSERRLARHLAQQGHEVIFANWG
jgi:hypothetical protein